MRDDNGEPTGLLLDMAGWLRERIGESGNPRADGLPAALREWGKHLLRYGVTTVTDAGPDNGPARWQAFANFIQAGTLPQRITMMVGHNRLGEMQRAGLGYGDAACDGMLTVGHAKIMLTASSGSLRPDPDELCEIVAMAHRMGYPVAIHAVERDAVVAAALAIGDHPPPVGQDRIEHCGECPPDVAELVAQSGARVVANTGFLHYDGERYLRTVSGGIAAAPVPGGSVGRCRRSGVAGIGCAGSGAEPVGIAGGGGVAALVSRRPAGRRVGFLSVADALDMHIGNNRIALGCPADLAVVEPNPLATPVADLPGVRAALTMVGGIIAWHSGI